MTCAHPVTSLADLASVIDACVVSITGIADWTPLALTGALVLLVPATLVLALWRLR